MGLCKTVKFTINKRRFQLSPGIYVYTGSALGAGGAEARINGHLKRFTQRRGQYLKNLEKARFHWHVDHLLPIAVSFTAVYAKVDYNIECLLTGSLKGMEMQVINGFGSTDCRSGCGGHLLRAPNNMEGAIRSVKEAFRGLGLEPKRSKTFKSTSLQE